MTMLVDDKGRALDALLGVEKTSQDEPGGLGDPEPLWMEDAVPLSDEDLLIAVQDEAWVDPEMVRELGITEKVADALCAAGLGGYEDLRQAAFEDEDRVLAVSGLGPATLQKIKDYFYPREDEEE